MWRITYPDVRMRDATKPDGVEYFEYVLLYVDDCLVISHKPEAILREEIGSYFGSTQYVRAVVDNVEDYLPRCPDEGCN